MPFFNVIILMGIAGFVTCIGSFFVGVSHPNGHIGPRHIHRPRISHGNPHGIG